MALQAGIILAITFAIFLFMSVPVSISIVLSSLVTISAMLTPEFGVFISAQKLSTGMDSFTLLAVPFFLLSGILMSEGGIAKRLVDCAMVFVGKIPGALAHTNIIGNAMFGSISGSGVAAAAAIGGVMGPLEEKAGYEKDFSAACNVASAPVGQLIPPTAAFIVYSLASGGASVAALFMAGWIPGILWALACMVVAYIYAKIKKYPVDAVAVPSGEAVKAIVRAIPSLLLIVIVLGGIIGGVFTPTEAAGVSVLYTFILSVFIYRSVGLKKLRSILVETVSLTSIIMLIIGASAIMSFLMSFTGIPAAISSAVLSISDSKYVLMMIILFILLFIGTFMDMAPALLIFTPIFLPIVTKLGVNPIHFGVVMVMNLAIGTITPPVGSVLFVGCSMSNMEMGPVIKKLFPFYAAIIVSMLLVAFIPELSTWLPSALKLM